MNGLSNSVVGLVGQLFDNLLTGYLAIAGHRAPAAVAVGRLEEEI